MKDEELRKYYEVYTDSWKVFRKYSDPDGTDTFWNNLRDEVDAIYRKHDKSHFAEKVLLATVNEIDRIYRERRTVNG